MPLKLMYITNRPDVALIAEKNGVERIMVDMEYIGKAERQHRMNTVQNHHTIEDIRNVREVLTKSELLVRVNPIHEAKPGEYTSSEEEINAVVEAGADIIMLPYFKTREEVERFITAVGGRTHTMILLETIQAVRILDRIMSVDGIDEVHIGLNDLSITCGYPFMFQSFANGLVDDICHELRKYGKPYGVGGIASLGRGMVKAELIIKDHYRLGSKAAILSRSFCNIDQFNDLAAVEEIFLRGINEIRLLEKECKVHADFFNKNKRALDNAINRVVSSMETPQAPDGAAGNGKDRA